MSDRKLIEVYAAGDTIKLIHEVSPDPKLREITKDKRVKVYTRSGLIQRLLKSGKLLAVRAPIPTARVVDSKDGKKDPPKK